MKIEQAIQEYNNGDDIQKIKPILISIDLKQLKESENISIGVREIDSFLKAIPELLKSLKIIIFPNNKFEFQKLRIYKNPETRPIYHRNEIYFPEKIPLHKKHKIITSFFESIGIFKEKGIGYKNKMSKLLSGHLKDFSDLKKRLQLK